jgi:hypothetical protein
MKTAGTAVTGTWHDRLEAAGSAAAMQVVGAGYTQQAIGQLRSQSVRANAPGYSEATRALWHLTEASIELINYHLAIGKEVHIDRP